MCHKQQVHLRCTCLESAKDGKQLRSTISIFFVSRCFLNHFQKIDLVKKDKQHIYLCTVYLSQASFR